MLLRKKRKKKKTVLILKTNKKRFQISCSNCTLHWKTNFLWYKNLLQHSCALFDAMIAKLPPIPPLTSYLCFFLAFIFLPLDKSTVQSKDSYRNKTPSPRKKILRLCSLQVINTSSHILCLFVMVNKKKKKSKQKQQQNQ